MELDASIIFQFVTNRNKTEGKLVTPILIESDRFGKVPAIHVYGDDNIVLWKI